MDHFLTTHQGYKYWITFIDDSTRFRSIHLLKSKLQAFEALKYYKAWAENQLSADPFFPSNHHHG